MGKHWHKMHLTKALEFPCFFFAVLLFHKAFVNPVVSLLEFQLRHICVINVPRLQQRCSFPDNLSPTDNQSVDLIDNFWGIFVFFLPFFLSFFFYFGVRSTQPH